MILSACRVRRLSLAALACLLLNPREARVTLSADEWVQLAKDAGMKYIVITAKHHDGFALYETKKDFDQYLRDKAEPQVRELLTDYGPSGSTRRA